MTVTIIHSENRYELFDVYNPSYRHGGKLNVTRMGMWYFETGLNMFSTQYKYERRRDLQGMRLNCSVVAHHLPENMEFETYLTTPVNVHLDTMHRFHYSYILLLRDYYNFSISLTRSSSWGYLKNGTYDGIIGDMTKGIVDISGTPLRMTTDRIDVVDFTVQNVVAWPKFFFRHPKKNLLTNQFFKPFTREVWILTTIMIIINWLLLYFAVKVEHHYRKSTFYSISETNTATEVALITTAAVCQQGLGATPNLSSGRIVFTSVFLWALILYQFYSASIVGSLLAAPSRFITTPEALLESSIEIGVEDIPYNYDFYSNSTDPVISGIYNKILKANERRKKPNFLTAEEGMKLVQRGGFAFQIDDLSSYRMIEDSFQTDEICELQEIYLFPRVHAATGVPKHSPFKKLVTYGLRHILERGVSSRITNVWKHRRPRCPESHSSLPTPVAIYEFSPALFAFVSGVIIALLIAVIENLIRYSSRQFLFETNQKIIEIFRVF
ncbi:hypothetical protein TKK_0008683 [Trichogramma kaykai]